ncbi:MAG: DUF1549 domain-containing protein [Planctomycetota bacterium]
MSRVSVQFAWMLLQLFAPVSLTVTLAADAPQPTHLTASPERIVLNTARDHQGIVVQAKLADGSTRDVSAVAKFEVAAPAVAKLNEGVLEPLTDGKTELRIEFEGLRCVVPVEVVRSTEANPPRFRNDVLPVFTRAGCNTGKCHGSASGKDGFRLSLFGYDPQGDHYRLTREISGRRINLAAPEESLLVNKSIGSVPHTGGQRIDPESEHYQTLLTWLTAGAEPDPVETPKPVRLEVFPRRAVFANKGEEQQIVVVVHYNDGSDRDVTDLAVFLSNNDSAATVSEHGLVTGTGSGSAFILARFDQFTEGTSIIVRPGTSYTFPEMPARNYIDELVYSRWKDMHLVPSELCSDETFLRRASIDLIGLLPTPEQRQQFLNDTDPNKREKFVDSLLEREEFRDLWVMKWAELLQIRTANGGSPKGLQLYDRWLRDSVRAGVTIDKIVMELIPATGGTFENPATSYYQTETTPQLLAENVAQAFLGTRIQCAQCHNHPFDRWTMDDYYGFAAFFSQVGYKQAPDPREITVFNAATGEMKHPLGNRTVSPKYLGGDIPTMTSGEDYRQSLAGWLASADNPVLARNLANVIWAHFLGIGIVEPVDDVRVSNPPSNPQLLDAIGQRLAGYRFEIKPLVRDICNSRTYQLTTRRNESNAWDERDFSHGRVRRLRAEVLLDCLNQVTETQDRFPGLLAGARAVQVADGRTPNYFLTTFGRSTRQTPCTCEVKTSPTLSQALHLINGETTSGKIEEGQLVERLLTERKEPMAVVADLYERCLSRQPTAKEAAAIQAKLAASPDAQAALVDLFWALLNSNEFIFNH